MGLKPFMITYMTVCHMCAAWGLYLVFTGCVSYATLAIACALYWLSVTGIGAGAHRLYTHRAYQAAPLLRLFLVACCSVANQGSVLHWARDHRVHHAYSETDADPHNAKRGFWFSHIGWLFVDKHARVLQAGNKVSLKDLWSDEFVAFQENNKHWLMPVACFVLPASLVQWMTPDSYVTGLLVAGFLRYVLVLHVTWCINSVAHMWGNRPYNEHINPRENWLVSGFALGEGFHNYHHQYPSDYRTSEFGLLGGQLNGSTLFIDACAMLGLAWARRSSAHKVKRDSQGAIISAKPRKLAAK